MAETHQTNQMETSLAATPAGNAVAHCLSIYDQTMQREKASGSTCCSWTSSAAYRRAMPPLTGYDNIRNFIACTAQGILIGAITESSSSKLLYAAQVALGSARAEITRQKAEK